MLYFESDYMEGAHPAIMQRLMETNLEPLSGYGVDHYCESAKEKILAACQCPQGQVFFLVGGTQTNRTVIDTMLAPYEGVLAAQTGHIATHEGGAIEAGGHKVLPLPQYQGKLSANDLARWLDTFYGDANHEHMVFPGMVYISHPTEYGTLYTKQELEALSRLCRARHIPLFLDGARLGYGLASRDTDVTLQDIARLCDVFYIGGTKVGALCGEAVVFTQGNMPPHFVGQAKQHGALLAKGRLLGIQFDTLFTDDLYMTISRHAIDQAMALRDIFRAKGYTLYLDSPTNQQFVVLENSQMERLKSQVAFGFWEALDHDHTVVRFATSWATRPEDVQALEALL
jgi:threonine aldolase